jgi:hypothetical protein
MATPQLYRQLIGQLGQWITPKDFRHLKNCAEIVAAILESESACLAHWIPYLSHRDCQARSHMERLSYFMHNPAITDELFYVPLLKQFLQEWTGQELILVMDTSMFWDTYCLIEVCVAWGGRSITLAQTVIKHGSSTVGFDQYLPVLAKDQVYLFPGIKVLGDVECNLGTANCRGVKEPWAVLTNTPLSLQAFQLYGKRFGGIEPRFKDYKSGTFDLLRSKIRDAQALSNLLMMIEIAEVLAIKLGLIVIETQQRSKVDWHGERGLSLLQLGIRTVKSLCHQAVNIPLLTPIPWVKILPACASLKKRAKLDKRIEFSKVVSFSY